MASGEGAQGLPGAGRCPEVAWHKIFQSLPKGEVVLASQAFLSSGSVRAAAEAAWDCQAALGEPWPRGAAGLRQFSAAAHALYFSGGVLGALAGGQEHVRASSGCRRRLPRSTAVPSAPAALAFSGGHLAGEGLLGVALGRDVRLAGREDLRSCGTVALSLPKGCSAAGALAFSPDGGALAVAPLADPARGGLAAEVQLYTTDGEKSKPVVTKLKQAVSAIDFLDSGDLVLVAGADLWRISPASGTAAELRRSDGGAFTSCEAVGPHEIMTLTDKVVEIWDVRQQGVASSLAAPCELAVLHAGAFRGASAAFAADAQGGLHRLDWRGAGGPRCELLWRSAAERAARPRGLVVERGCACVVAGGALTLLAVEPAVVELGRADVGEQAGSTVTAVASAPGAWALGVETSSKQGASYSVFVVDSNGDAAFNEAKREASLAAAQRAENQKKLKDNKKKEQQGKKPSSGKSAHGRNSGR